MRRNNKRKSFDAVAEKAVDSFFSSFQKEFEIVCLKFKLATMERTHGYHHLGSARALSDLKDALERQGRKAEADELVERAGRLALESTDTDQLAAAV